MIFARDTSTHNLYKCVGGVKNIHDELTSNVLEMLRNGKRLTLRKKVKYWDMECDNSQNIRSRNCILVHFKMLNNINHVCAFSVHFRSSTHIRYVNGAGVLREPMACAVPVYLTTDISG